MSTASRCLSGAAKVAKSTERRILAAAKATGYHHNTLVGQVMRAMAGKGNPTLVNEILTMRLK